MWTLGAAGARPLCDVSEVARHGEAFFIHVGVCDIRWARAAVGFGDDSAQLLELWWLALGL